MSRPFLRGIIILPSALTLGNLFFGFWAIVSAFRGSFVLAAWLIVLGGLADMLDGRIARVTRTGSRFGAELDSLVDAISFGVAPAIMVYLLFLADGTWGWIACYFYLVGVVVRLARFNIEQAGGAKLAFHGLPSPIAGISLATFYPFSQTPLFQTYLGALPWPAMITAHMVILSLLMMSQLLYPVLPTFGFRSARGLLTLGAMLAALVATFTVPALFFFPASLLYISWGIVKALVLGFFERLPEHDPLLDEELSEEDESTAREIDYAELGPLRRRLWPLLRRSPAGKQRERESADESGTKRRGSARRREKRRGSRKRSSGRSGSMPAGAEPAARPDRTVAESPEGDGEGNPPVPPQREGRQ